MLGTRCFPLHGAHRKAKRSRHPRPPSALVPIASPRRLLADRPPRSTLSALRLAPVVHAGSEPPTPVVSADFRSLLRRSEWCLSPLPTAGSAADPGQLQWRTVWRQMLVPQLHQQRHPASTLPGQPVPVMTYARDKGRQALHEALTSSSPVTPASPLTSIAFGLCRSTTPRFPARLPLPAQRVAARHRPWHPAAQEPRLSAPPCSGRG